MVVWGEGQDFDGPVEHSMFMKCVSKDGVVLRWKLKEFRKMANSGKLNLYPMKVQYKVLKE